MSNPRAATMINHIRPGRPDAEKIKHVVLGCFGVADRLLAERERLARDFDLSDAGRRKALNEFAKKVARDLADISKPTRNRKADLANSRAECVPEPLDRTDGVAEQRRAEIRTFLRSLSPADRILQVTKNPTFSEAVADAPGVLSGLTEPGVYERFVQEHRDAAVKKRFGDRLQHIEDTEEDWGNADAAFQVVANDLQHASGLRPDEFQAMLKPLLEGKSS